MTRPDALSLLLAGLVLLPSSALAQTGADRDCGGETPCPVTLSDGDTGQYYLAQPPGWDGVRPLPVVMWFHGYRGSGLNGIRNEGLVGGWTAAGYLFVAGDGRGNTWSHQGSPSQERDDNLYVEAVIDDVMARFPVDGQRIVAAGFSQGGSMVWSVACFVGPPFTHFAPVSGAFWEPLPEACRDGAIAMRHTHGTADTVVPVAGRPIGADWHQGDLFESLGILGRSRACAATPEAGAFTVDGSTCETYACTQGAIEICLHDGGHGVPAGWSPAIRAWVEDNSG
ncbi:MAG: hypothetical protein RLO50_10775 [Azospirillaceae bacterium]